MACDICGKKGCDLVDLRDSYKTDDIQQICHGCEYTVNKHLFKLKNSTHRILCDWMKRFMAQLKGGEKC